MIKSFLHNRQYVLFDANNRAHRQAYFDFLKTGSWTGCKFNFVTEEPYLDLPSYINMKISEYYLKREFTAIKTKIHIH